MLQVKRWAKHYLTMSPIFKHNIFNQPKHEHIMRVNTRLLTAYCLNMLQLKHYDASTVTAILHLYNHHTQCYFNTYLHSILHHQTYHAEQQLLHAKQQAQTERQPVKSQRTDGNDTEITQPEQQERRNVIQNIIRLRCLIAKTFHKTVTKQQFGELAQLYLTLLDKQHITEMDNFTIDLSLHTLTHIATFADMKQSAQLAIGQHSLSLLHSLINKCQIAQYFSVITILNRVRSQLDGHAQLKLLTQWVQIQADHKHLMQQNKADSVFLQQQSVVLMVWLLHIYQVGEFVYQNLRKNYLLMEYQQHSLKLVGKLLNCLQTHGMHKQHVVLLSEVISKMQQLQQHQDIYEQYQQNIQMSKTLHRLRNKLSQTIQTVQPIQHPILLLQQLNTYQIDFHSAHSHKLIQQYMANIIADPHSPLLLTTQQIHCLMELAAKIDNTQLRNKLTAKFKHQIYKQTSRKLIDYLTRIAHQKQGGSIQDLSIGNICQLQRVKFQLTTKTATLRAQLKVSQGQMEYLRNLRVLLTDGNSQIGWVLLGALCELEL